MGKININTKNVESDIQGIRLKLAAVSNVSLSPADTESTITANKKSQDAYTKAQAIKVSYATAVNKAANEILGLNSIFKDLDQMLAKKISAK